MVTTHGEPQAAIVDSETFEAVHGAVMHLLLAETEASFNRMQEAVRRQSERGVQTSEDELEKLVREVVHRAGKERSRAATKKKRRE